MNITQDELHLIEWKHPYKGTIRVVACLSHERIILDALHVLSIGCLGMPAGSADGPCIQCSKVGRGGRSSE